MTTRPPSTFRRVIMALLASLIVHIPLLDMPSLIDITKARRPLIRVETISQEELAQIKLRQAGKKNGERDLAIKLSGAPIATAHPKIDLSSLQVGVQDVQNITPTENRPSRENEGRAFRKALPTLDNRKTLSAITLSGKNAKDYLANTAVPRGGISIANPILQNSDFSIKLELPDGVKLDDLNREELMFYSFQQRAIGTYISSFYKILGEFALRYPQVDISSTSGEERLTGRVVFDQHGQMRGIRLIRQSNRDRVQEFFIDVLQGIILPNPPKAILNSDGEFAFYFTLVLKG